MGKEPTCWEETITTCNCQRVSVDKETGQQGMVFQMAAVWKQNLQESRPRKDASATVWFVMWVTWRQWLKESLLTIKFRPDFISIEFFQQDLVLQSICCYSQAWFKILKLWSCWGLHWLIHIHPRFWGIYWECVLFLSAPWRKSKSIASNPLVASRNSMNFPISKSATGGNSKRPVRSAKACCRCGWLTKPAGLRGDLHRWGSTPLCVCTYVYIYILVYIHIYIYIDIHDILHIYIYIDR